MTTLSQLKTSVDAWLVRDDIAVSGTDFPQILLNAESQIARHYRFVQQEQDTTLTLTSRRGDLPANVIELRNPFIDDNVRKFEYKTPQALREAPSWDSGRQTAFYTIEGGGGTSPDDRAQIVVNTNPTASDPVDIDILYWARFDPLVADTDTNWLLQNHYDVYLYETLYQAAIYIQEVELAESYLAMCKEMRNDFKIQENRKRYTAVPKQSYAHPRGVV